MKARNSFIELLKIIGILLIVFSHIRPGNVDGFNSSIDLRLIPSTFDLTYSYMILARHLGAIGNYLFIIPSCFFFLKSDKISWQKIVLIVLDVFIIAATYALIYIIQGYALTTYQYVFNLTPLAVFDKWFIYSYLVLYIAHPLLNKLLCKMKQKIHLLIVVASLVLSLTFLILELTVSSFITITQMFGLFFIYFILSYQDKYLINKDNKVLNVLEAVFSFLIIILYCAFAPLISNSLPFLKDSLDKLGQIYNPLTFMVAMPIFNLLRNKEPFVNKTINFLASESLLIYLISENSLFKIFTRQRMFEYCYNQFPFYNPALFSFILSLLVAFICGAIGSIYKLTISKGLNYLFYKTKTN